MRDDIDMEGLRAKLLARRAELEEGQSTRDEACGAVELDQSRTGRLSRMDALRGQAMAQAGQQRAALELQRIQAALNRMASGDYGYCIECGEEIEAARLAIDPANPLCLQCASAGEREGR